MAEAENKQTDVAQGLLNHHAAALVNVAKRAGVRHVDVEAAIKRWNGASNGAETFIYQDAAERVFGAPQSAWQRRHKVRLFEGSTFADSHKASVKRHKDRLAEIAALPDNAYQTAEDVADGIVTAMYNLRQESLRKADVKELILYRGVRSKVLNRTALIEDENIEYVGNALESWSCYPAQADRFAGFKGAVMRALIPAERVFARSGTGMGVYKVGEVVVMATDGSTDVVTIHFVG